MRRVTDDGRGQAELRLYELTTITGLKAEQERGVEKIASLYGLKDIKRQVRTHTHTHTHTHSLPLAFCYQGHVNHNIILDGTL